MSVLITVAVVVVVLILIGTGMGGSKRSTQQERSDLFDRLLER